MKSDEYEVWVLEYSQYSDNYTTQRNVIQSMLGDRFISLGWFSDNDVVIHQKYLSIKELVGREQFDLIHLEVAPETYDSFNKLDTDSTFRAAELCKADLVTSMVVEMTALQGIMGKYYTLQSGEPETAALAIEEHYLPRYAGDRLPETRPGLAVGLADRLDSLVGLFSVGMAPTGARDPFGLRRAAIGLLLILTRKGIELDLAALIASAGSLLPVTSTLADQQACQDFIVGRLENQLLEESFRYDAVKSVLAEQGSNPARALDGVKALSDWIARDDWREILPAFARCVRITRDQKEVFTVKEPRLSMPEEKILFQGVRQAQSVLDKERTIPVFLTQLVKMIPAINAFFDAVLVMDENIQVRQNRLGMLQELAGMASGLADFSCLEGF